MWFLLSGQELIFPVFLPFMESLNTFESEMEPDGQGSYSLFPALDSIASLSGTAEALERWILNTSFSFHVTVHWLFWFVFVLCSLVFASYYGVLRLHKIIFKLQEWSHKVYSHNIIRIKLKYYKKFLLKKLSYHFNKLRTVDHPEVILCICVI